MLLGRLPRSCSCPVSLDSVLRCRSSYGDGDMSEKGAVSGYRYLASARL